MEAPLRSYNKILVHNYQLAIAAENPFLEFVSYYQIMEHFFEQVFSEHVVSMARDEISSPAFSLKRKADIQSLVKKSKELAVSGVKMGEEMRPRPSL